MFRKNDFLKDRIEQANATTQQQMAIFALFLHAHVQKKKKNNM